MIHCINRYDTAYLTFVAAAHYNYVISYDKCLSKIKQKYKVEVLILRV